MAFHWLASMRRSAIREASTPACKKLLEVVCNGVPLARFHETLCEKRGIDAP